MKETTKMSRTIGQLEKMFRTINHDLFNDELPETVITVQRSPGSYGHSTVHKVWKKKDTDAYELNIADLTLNLNIEETIDTLIHEGIHLYCRVHEIKETSNKGYYHNKKFKELAEERHLKCVDTGKYGWNTEAEGNDWLTEYAIENDWTEFKTKRNVGLIDLFPGGIKGAAGNDTSTNDGKAHGAKTSSYIKWVCPKCGAIVRSTKKLNIICGDCNETFVEA